MTNENLENLPVGWRQPLNHKPHLAHSYGLTLMLNRGNEARVQLVGHQGLGELAQVLLHSAGERLGLPDLGVRKADGGVPRLRVNGLAQQAFHLGDHAADTVQALQEEQKMKYSVKRAEVFTVLDLRRLEGVREVSNARKQSQRKRNADPWRSCLILSSYP
jgi:hypothetical protein